MNKLPISPAKPKLVAPKSSGGQQLLTLSGGGELGGLQNSNLGNLLMLPNYMVISIRNLMLSCIIFCASIILILMIGSFHKF